MASACSAAADRLECDLHCCQLLQETHGTVLHQCVPLCLLWHLPHLSIFLNVANVALGMPSLFTLCLSTCCRIQQGCRTSDLVTTASCSLLQESMGGEAPGASSSGAAASSSAAGASQPSSQRGLRGVADDAFYK